MFDKSIYSNEFSLGSIYEKGNDKNNDSIFGSQSSYLEGKDDNKHQSPFAQNNQDQSPFSFARQDEMSHPANAMKIPESPAFSEKLIDNNPFNVKKENYKHFSVTDSLRGVQAKRTNIDTENISLSDQYADNALDQRVFGGLYNVTITDIYSDEKKFNEYFGFNSDGMIEIDEKNESLKKDKLRKKEEISEKAKKDNVFSKTENKTDAEKILSDTGKTAFEKVADGEIIKSVVEKKDPAPTAAERTIGVKNIRQSTGAEKFLEVADKKDILYEDDTIKKADPEEELRKKKEELRKLQEFWEQNLKPKNKNQSEEVKESPREKTDIELIGEKVFAGGSALETVTKGLDKHSSDLPKRKEDENEDDLLPKQLSGTTGYTKYEIHEDKKDQTDALELETKKGTKGFDEEDLKDFNKKREALEQIYAEKSLVSLEEERLSLKISKKKDEYETKFRIEVLEKIIHKKRIENIG